MILELVLHRGEPRSRSRSTGEAVATRAIQQAGGDGSWLRKMTRSGSDAELIADRRRYEPL